MAWSIRLPGPEGLQGCRCACTPVRLICRPAGQPTEGLNRDSWTPQLLTRPQGVRETAILVEQHPPAGGLSLGSCWSCNQPILSQGKYIDVVTKVQRRANDAMRGENRQLFEDMMNLTLFPASLEPTRSSPERAVPAYLVLPSW